MKKCWQLCDIVNVELDLFVSCSVYHAECQSEACHFATSTIHDHNIFDQPFTTMEPKLVERISWLVGATLYFFI